MNPVTLLNMSCNKISGSTLNSHVDLKKLILNEAALATNSTPLIYDPTLYLFHKIYIFSAVVSQPALNQLLTWGLYLVWPGEPPSLFIHSVPKVSSKSTTQPTWL